MKTKKGEIPTSDHAFLMAAMSGDSEQYRQILEARRQRQPTPEEVEWAQTQAARQDERGDEMEFWNSQGKEEDEMRKAGLSLYMGGLEEPIFWQDGKVVETGAVRLDFYESRHELKILKNTARAFQEQGGYELPKNFLLEAAQIFYREGQVCEVRLSGYDMTPRRDEQGSVIFTRWQTPTAPEVRATEKGVQLTPDKQQRPQIAVLNETAQEALTLERDYLERLRKQQQIAPPKGVLRLLVAWNTSGDLATVLEDAQRANAYNILTSQEITILERSACDGKRGNRWRTDTQSQRRIYEEKNASHRVELELTPEDEDLDVTMAALEKLTKVQDADFAFSMSYICRVLAPPAPLPQNLAAIGWIDLDDVMQKIGWNPSKRSISERDQMRERIWGYIVYGDRAKVIGRRTIDYTDPNTGQVIDTRLESAIWRIMDKQRPLQANLFGEVPHRVQLVIGKQWEPLLTAPELAQYFPLCELLASIAPNQVAGDWARSIGLVLASFWRRNPRETIHTETVMDGEGYEVTVPAPLIRPTRRELLTGYTPKTKTVDELLDSNDPRRAVIYWRDALGKLLELEVIARHGEPTRTVTDMLKPFEGSYGWQQAWLDEQVLILPGPKFHPHVQERVEALPPLKPQNLKKRGRSRKRLKAG